MNERYKQVANELSELYINELNQVITLYQNLYNSGEFNCVEMYLICKLTDIYIAIKESVIDKNEGIRRQKNLFDTIKIEK